jgi:hypothetical protein
MTNRSDEDLINAAANYFLYKTQTGSSGSSMQSQMDTNEIKALTQELHALKTKIRQGQAEEETYNEMYLDNKKNPKTFGLFGKLGLRTTQDWVFALFYFSYTVFSISLILYFLPYSKDQKMRLFLTMLFLLFMVGFMITIMLFNYA